MRTGLKLKLTIISIFSVIGIHAQTVLNLYITDHFKRPLPFAIVKYGDFSKASNELGFFRIARYVPGSKIEVHKLGFTDTTVILAPALTTRDTINLTIGLSLKLMVLPEVSISSSQMEEINPLKSDFVVGYELKGDYLVELLSDDNMVVLDLDNKVNNRSRIVSGATGIQKDPKGNLYILTEKAAFLIDPEIAGPVNSPMYTDLAKVKWDMLYCDDVTETTRFIRRYKDNNQTVGFFAISAVNQNDARLLKEISNAAKKNAVKAFADETNNLLSYLAVLTETNPAGVMGDITGEELVLYRLGDKMVSQLENNYVLPSYSYLKLVNDSIFLFAHDIDSMFVYDRDGNLVKGKRINYHHLKMWGKELIVNEEKTKVYAKLIENAKPMIAEVDLQTGALKPPMVTLETKFPGKIRIRNGVAYFMAKQKDGTGYTVYSQKIQ